MLLSQRLSYTNRYDERLPQLLWWRQKLRRALEDGAQFPRKTNWKWLPVWYMRRALGVPHAGDHDPADRFPTQQRRLSTRDL